MVKMKRVKKCVHKSEQYFDPLGSYYGVSERCCKCGERLLLDDKSGRYFTLRDIEIEAELERIQIAMPTFRSI